MAVKMIMHFITSYANTMGAERMLTNVLRDSRGEHVCVVALVKITDRNRQLVSCPNIEYIGLGVRSSVGIPAAIMKLARLIRQRRPKVIVCWMYHAMAIGLVAARISGFGKHVIWNVRTSLDDLESLSSSAQMALQMCKRLSGSATAIMYNSHRSRDQHVSFGFSGKNDFVIPNGFELPILESVESRPPLVLGFAGRYHPAKDFDNLFESIETAFNRHPRATFIIAGRDVSADTTEFIKHFRSQPSIAERIHFYGELRDMSAFYRRIDGLVLSSRVEGFPNVVGEAMSYGKPVISTDVGDAARIVANTGFVVPPRRPDLLAKAIDDFLCLSADDYTVLSGRARQRIEREYQLSVITDKYRHFIVSHCRTPTYPHSNRPVK